MGTLVRRLWQRGQADSVRAPQLTRCPPTCRPWISSNGYSELQASSGCWFWTAAALKRPQKASAVTSRPGTIGERRSLLSRACDLKETSAAKGMLLVSYQDIPPFSRKITKDSVRFSSQEWSFLIEARLRLCLDAVKWPIINASKVCCVVLEMRFRNAWVRGTHYGRRYTSALMVSSFHFIYWYTFNYKGEPVLSHHHIV